MNVFVCAACRHFGGVLSSQGLQCTWRCGSPNVTRVMFDGDDAPPAGCEMMFEHLIVEPKALGEARRRLMSAILTGEVDLVKAVQDFDLAMRVN